MTTERRKETSDDDSLIVTDCLPSSNYKVPSRRKRQKEKINKAKLGPILSAIANTFPSTRTSLMQFTYNMKHNRYSSIRRLLFKAAFYLWCLTVCFSIMSLVGINVFQPLSILTFTDEDQDFSGRRSLQTSASDEEGLINWFPSTFSLGSLGEFGKEKEETEERDDSIEEDEEDDIPEQVLPMTPKLGNKLNKKFEHQLGCEEEDCNASCNAKIKPKCARSASCRKEREKLCRRRCRKTRCENRCKDEPKFGYVEREQRMEKCKEECSGPTAVHNKCIKKCHSQFKPCKSRCHEIAGKYGCDRVKEVSLQKTIEDSFETSLSMDMDEII
eukprot:snap_masked-scaffold_49-processed-gene-0.33-mRNA-1 protein AED:1.00 eAED:1.00 QI:0/-1/0/0/-1/1/1/0/328